LPEKSSRCRAAAWPGGGGRGKIKEIDNWSPEEKGENHETADSLAGSSVDHRHGRAVKAQRKRRNSGNGKPSGRFDVEGIERCPVWFDRRA
jgi:hypothetical protein